MTRPGGYFQAEAAECGLACLATVAAHHGLELTIVELRQRFPLSLRGVRLGQLMRMARQLGMRTRAVRLDMEGLSSLRLPCILHWDMNHFVVLTEVNRNRVTIHDPAIGEVKLRLAEAADRFTGIALEVTPDAGFAPRKRAPAVSLRQLTGGIKGLVPALGQLLAMSVAMQLLVLIAPLYIQWTIDQVLLAADRSLALVLAIGFAFLLLIQVVIGQVRGWAVVYLSSRLNLQWTGNVFHHMLRLPQAFFEKRNMGDVTSRLSSVQAIQRTLTTGFVEAVMDGLLVGVTLIVILLYSPRLALVTLVAVAAYFLLRTFFYRRLRTDSERQLIASAKQQSYLLETLRGMQSLKLAGGESLRSSGYENLVVSTINQEARLARLSLGFVGANQLVFGFERILVIFLGALLVIDRTFSVGMLVAFLAYKDQFAMRTAALIDKWVEFRMLRLHGERLADIVLTQPEDSGGTLPPQHHDLPRLTLDDVWFRYADDEPWILAGCSIEIEPGASVAIVGPSGSGKTTLLKLMLGLLTPTQGTLRLDGQDIRQIGPENYRSLLGAVMQDDQLFAGSVGENIAFFDNDATQEQIESAARLAAVHEEIAAMPMGYHTLIGDMGSSLSGGQKQRIILARALFRQPRLLFLDEATSHLDVACEQQVNHAIQALRLTRILVAHRPETIASADSVLRLQDGVLIRG